MSPPNAIEADGLDKHYGSVRALDGLSLSVPAGRIFGLLGPNGAGKSTAVKILTTLSLPDHGTAAVGGFDVLAQPAAVRRVIGVVGQRHGAVAELTGRENLHLQGRIHGLGGRDLTARVSSLLERFGLVEAGDRVTRRYSGGMQRRLDIALALVHDPQMLFLDEPTTGLDPELRAELWMSLSGLAAERGITILLTTHYLEEADQFASQLAIVDRGRIVALGSPDDLKSELHGDSVQIELRDAATADRAREELERIEGIGSAVSDGATVRARALDGPSAVPVVLSALDGAGVGVAAVTVARPSLDDVYLHYTGRAFRTADASPTEAIAS